MQTGRDYSCPFFYCLVVDLLGCARGRRAGGLFDEASCHEIVSVQLNGVVEHFELHWLVELA